MVRMTLFFNEGNEIYKVEQLYIDCVAAESSLPDWFDLLGIKKAMVEIRDVKDNRLICNHPVGDYS